MKSNSNDLFIDADDPLEDPPGRKAVRPTRARRQRFAQVDLVMASAAFKALDCPVAMVWVAIVYRVWAEKKNTVVLSTQMLIEFGVGRMTKYRALKRLEAARLIRVKWRAKKNPIVTVLGTGKL